MTCQGLSLNCIVIRELLPNDELSGIRRRWNRAGFSNLTPEGQHMPNGGKRVQINPRIRFL